MRNRETRPGGCPVRMRLLLVSVACLMLLSVALPSAAAGPDTFPVCKDKDVRAGPYAHLHVGVDCEPGVYAVVCAPTQPCVREDVTLR